MHDATQCAPGPRRRRGIVLDAEQAPRIHYIILLCIEGGFDLPITLIRIKWAVKHNT